jgi:hypothetical protein
MSDFSRQEHITRRLTLPDLSGTLIKTLVVPDDFIGVALGPQPQVYPPGKHRVVTFWQRLFGKVGDRR